ncbi:hypothetical protein Q0Z83_022760 [Actinoplanes sichuanensis]|uniref:Uncharacterized protein n=1 Tax=Actinoplanes sichuanensis TaxID=512349 RepID=A0ABW4AIN3_9ACTN|nr:hypothetical protein [Actinoplanes sichuanensis]BEL04085.1 hypothetical protein Q0Z83_022760 [Actinoplanes sichuanensis]
MSLTGLPLILVVACGVIVSAAVTVSAWRRDWRPRLLVRPVGILVTEALLLVGIGLVVNRSELFYPSWSDLLQSSDGAAPRAATQPGALDGWLRSHGGTFTWQPSGWADWHLAAAPTVVVPADYLDHSDLRYSVVVVLGDGGTDPPAGAEQTVVVYARTTAATTAATLTEDLPARLGHDLRVTGRRWALVTPASDVALADQAAAVPGRYPVIAVVRGRSAAAALIVDRSGGTPALAGVTVGAGDGLADAVAWAAQQTPPPLAAAVPPVSWLPVHRRPHRPATSAPTRTGGSRVPGQPRL